MKTVENLANGKTGGRPSLLRHMVDIFQQGMANYTPTGPGSLATGQAAAAQRSGRSAHAGDVHDQIRPAYMEFAMPLRQVFWI